MTITAAIPAFAPTDDLLIAAGVVHLPRAPGRPRTRCGLLLPGSAHRIGAWQLTWRPDLRPAVCLACRTGGPR
jgi:hypothetical protein